LPLLDLTEALRRDDRGLLGGPYYEYDPHWNAKGHAIAAAEVAHFLETERWLRSACASENSAEPAWDAAVPSP